MNDALNQPAKQSLEDIRAAAARGELDVARPAAESLAGQWPRDVSLLHSLGTIFLQAQDYRTAIYYFRKSVTVNPREPDYLLALSTALAQSGKAAAGLETLMKLLKIDLNHADALNLLYDICCAVIQEGGVKRNPITPLIKAYPEIITLRSVAVRICRSLNEHAERLIHLEALYRHGVRGDVFYQEYGVMLRDNGQFERSLSIAEEALQAYPHSHELRKLRAHVLLSLGQPAKALLDWQAIVAMAPQDHQARLSVGIIKLLVSNGHEGYEEYGAHRDRALAQYGVDMGIPEWRGEPLGGKKLLLWCSQGIGDIIMFASLIPWVIKQGAQITLMLPEKLIALFTRSFPTIHIVPHVEAMLPHYAQACDFHSVLGQLMQYVLRHYTPSLHPGFLMADQAFAQTLRNKYLGVSPRRNAKKIVGIAWDTQNKDTFSQRNIALNEWGPLLSLPHIQFISLQYGDHAATIEAIGRKFPGALYCDTAIDAYENIDGLAAQIAAMDEVVSIQNATAHLAGAMGIPTTLMLSAASDWRWGLGVTDSRWYKSIHIERQQKLLDWAPVLTHVRNRLAPS